MALIDSTLEELSEALRALGYWVVYDVQRARENRLICGTKDEHVTITGQQAIRGEYQLPHLITDDA